MPLLNKRKQLASALEDIAGTAPVGLASTVGNYDVLAIEPEANFDIESFERDFVRSTISRLKNVQGQKALEFTFGTELKGTQAGTFAAGTPGFAKWLRAAGMRQEPTDTLDLDDAGTPVTVTGGPYRHGEVVSLTFAGGTGGTAGSGTVVHDTHNGATTMYLYDVTAPVAGSAHTGLTVLGASTGATCTLTDITDDTEWATAYTADAGYSWWPISDPLKSLDTDDVIDAAANAGDLIEGQTSGARAIFVATTTDTPKKMQFRPVRGTFAAGEVLQNLTQAVKYSDTDATDTAETYEYGNTIGSILNEDGVAATLLGGRANFVMVLEVNRPVRLNFTGRGFLQSVADLALVTGTSLDLTTPPLWQNASTLVADNETTGEEDEADEVAPCFANMEVDLGAQLADRRCASATTGLEEVFISEREGTVTFDPEATLETDIDWLGKLQSGICMRMRMTIGSALGNQFYVTLPGIQYDGASTGDRDGIMTREMTARLTGGNLNNLNGASVALEAIGGDNELVMTYLTNG